MHDGTRRAIVAAFLANLGIAISKFVAFAVTGSASMLAESIHSVADTGNQGLLFLGGRRSRRAPTAAHPFGFGHERYFWAFVVALVLFSLGSLFALVEGIDKLRDPHDIASPAVALGILGVALVLELFSLRTAVRSARPERGELSWWRYIRRSKSPELPVVLLEDLGALTGLFFALTGVMLAHYTDNARWDAAGSVAIGLLLLVISIVLAIEMKGLLIGESAAPAKQDAITDAIRQTPNVERVIHMKTEHIGPEELLVAVKVAFRSDLTIQELAESINETERRIRSAVAEARIIYIEPDVYRDDLSDISTSEKVDEPLH